MGLAAGVFFCSHAVVRLKRILIYASKGQQFRWNRYNERFHPAEPDHQSLPCRLLRRSFRSRRRRSFRQRHRSHADLRPVQQVLVDLARLDHLSGRAVQEDLARLVRLAAPRAPAAPPLPEDRLAQPDQVIPAVPSGPEGQLHLADLRAQVDRRAQADRMNDCSPSQGEILPVEPSTVNALLLQLPSRARTSRQTPILHYRS